jgi:hypothetical protein
MQPRSSLVVSACSLSDHGRDGARNRAANGNFGLAHDFRKTVSTITQMRLRFLLHLGLVAIALQFSTRAPAADVIHDNGTSSGVDGWEMTVWWEADDFVLPERTQLSGFQFWNYAQTGHFTGVVTWQIYANGSGNIPGQLVASGTSTNLTNSHTGYALLIFSSRPSRPCRSRRSHSTRVFTGSLCTTGRRHM